MLTTSIVSSVGLIDPCIPIVSRTVADELPLFLRPAVGFMLDTAINPTSCFLAPPFSIFNLACKILLQNFAFFNSFLSNS